MSADNWVTCPSCGAEDQLREDYEFYINSGGEFHADFYCSCQECGFKFKFNHKEVIVKGERAFGCPKCKIEHGNKEDVYCSKCGTKLITFVIR
jgi:hypothetical protein